MHAVQCGAQNQTSSALDPVKAEASAKGFPVRTSVTVNVASSGTPVKGAFKLVFASPGHDSFSAVILSQGLSAYKPASGIVNGTVTVAGMNFPFTYDPVSTKAFGSNGMKIAVSPKSGTVTITLKNVSLASAFAGAGATNATVSGTTVSVPVSVVFGDGSALTLFNSIPFNYFAIANKVGAGKF